MVGYVRAVLGHGGPYGPLWSPGAPGKGPGAPPVLSSGDWCTTGSLACTKPSQAAETSLAVRCFRPQKER